MGSEGNRGNVGQDFGARIRPAGFPLRSSTWCGFEVDDGIGEQVFVSGGVDPHYFGGGAFFMPASYRRRRPRGQSGAPVQTASSIEPKRAGKSSRYLRVLNCASEYGLSLET